MDSVMTLNDRSILLPIKPRLLPQTYSEFIPVASPLELSPPSSSSESSSFSSGSSASWSHSSGSSTRSIIYRPTPIRTPPSPRYIDLLPVLPIKEKKIKLTCVENLEACVRDFRPDSMFRSSWYDHDQEFGGGEIVFRALELSIGSNWCRQNLVQEPLSAIYSNEAFIWSTIFHQTQYRIILPLSHLTSLHLTPFYSPIPNHNPNLTTTDDLLLYFHLSHPPLFQTKPLSSSSFPSSMVEWNTTTDFTTTSTFAQQENSSLTSSHSLYVSRGREAVRRLRQVGEENERMRNLWR